MITGAFDTLKFVQTLRDRGHLSAEQAEAIAFAMVEAFEDDIATKSFVRETEPHHKADIAEAKSDIIKWMFGTIGSQTVVILGAVAPLVRLGHG